MATTVEFRDWMLADCCQGSPDVRCRAMMGEYLLYYRDRLVGGLYDNRLLVKPVAGATHYLDKAADAPPYPGAKRMIEVDNLDTPGRVLELFQAMWPDLPAPKAKGTK